MRKPLRSSSRPAISLLMVFSYLKPGLRSESLPTLPDCGDMVILIFWDVRLGYSMLEEYLGSQAYQNWSWLFEGIASQMEVDHAEGVNSRASIISLFSRRSGIKEAAFLAANSILEPRSHFDT